MRSCARVARTTSTTSPWALVVRRFDASVDLALAMRRAGAQLGVAQAMCRAKASAMVAQAVRRAKASVMVALAVRRAEATVVMALAGCRAALLRRLSHTARRLVRVGVFWIATWTILTFLSLQSIRVWLCGMMIRVSVRGVHM